MNVIIQWISCIIEQSYILRQQPDTEDIIVAGGQVAVGVVGVAVLEALVVGVAVRRARVVTHDWVDELGCVPRLKSYL